MINHCGKVGRLVSMCLIINFLYGQESLIVGGGFQANGNLFLRDSQIGAINIPQYDHELFGAEAWLELNAAYSGFNAGLRFDMFNNSNLLNPQGSYTDQGIGKWYIQKELDRFEVNVGYIYDQIGSGTIYRAWEERAQLIDNALIGFMGKFSISNNWSVRAFTGRQRNLFSQFNSVLKGIAVNGFYQPSDSSKFSMAPGFGFVNRTLGKEIVTELAAILGGYIPEEQFKPSYNANAFSLFNHLTFGSLSWYAEVAYKPDDVFYDPNAILKLGQTQTAVGKLVRRDGSVFYTTLSYLFRHLGLTVDWKRTEGMDFRAEPLLSLNRGLINYIPPTSRLNTYRLTAYYYPATQFLSEQAVQLDVKYNIGDYLNLSANYSDIRDKDFKRQFYRELYIDGTFRKGDKWQLNLGLQTQFFDEEIYFGKGGKPDIKTITPFGEFLYKFSNTKSIRVEAQYMYSEQNIGSWINGVVEIGFAPYWLFEIADMYNIKPLAGKKALNYPSAGMVFTYGAHRFGLRYVKQIEGIVCSGGICRLEPAFSGWRANVTTNF